MRRAEKKEKGRTSARSTYDWNLIWLPINEECLPPNGRYLSALRQLETKWASISAGAERACQYTTMNTAPMAAVISTACNPRLQWARPKAIAEIASHQRQSLTVMLAKSFR